MNALLGAVCFGIFYAMIVDGDFVHTIHRCDEQSAEPNFSGIPIASSSRRAVRTFLIRRTRPG